MALKKGKRAQLERLGKALGRLESAWSTLDPTDLTKERWGQLQAVLLAVQAKINRTKEG